MSTLEVNTINPQSGSTITLGSSGNTVALGSGATAGFGKIGQVVSTDWVGEQSTSSSSFVDITNSSLSITPSSTSSKILVTFHINGIRKDGVNGYGSFQLVGSGGSSLSKKVGHAVLYTDSASKLRIGSQSGTFLDSPATTSLCTYKLQMVSLATGIQITVGDNGDTRSSITLMEVLA